MTQTLLDGKCFDIVECPNGYYNIGDNTCTVGPTNCTTVASVTGLCKTCNSTFIYDSTENTCDCNSDEFINYAGYC